MTWWCQATFHTWLLPCRRYGIPWRGSVSLGAESCCWDWGCPTWSSSSVSGSFPKGDQGAGKDALFPGLTPESIWGTVKAESCGGPVELIGQIPQQHVRRVLSTSVGLILGICFAKLHVVWSMKFNIIEKYSSDKYMTVISNNIHEILNETALPVIDDSSPFFKLSLQHFAPLLSWCELAVILGL